MFPRRLLRNATRTARHLAVALTAALGAVLVASACTSKASSVGAGGECFLATDCAPGLVCIEQANKTRICSDDLSRVAGRPPPDGAAADAADEAGEGGTGVDGEAPDQLVPPPPDANVEDTSAPPPDTGPPPDDAATD